MVFLSLFMALLAGVFSLPGLIAGLAIEPSFTHHEATWIGGLLGWLAVFIPVFIWQTVSSFGHGTLRQLWTPGES
jgi:hypothetical protein